MSDQRSLRPQRRTHSVDSLQFVELLPSDDNPFREFPDLACIWAPELAILAEDAIDETFAEFHLGHPDYGQIFLIYAQGALDSKPIGITGYFPWPDDGSSIGLRWHGLQETYRGTGASRSAMELMRQLACQHYPHAQTFIEFMPVISAYQPIRNYFKSLGFLAYQEPVEVDWSASLWQEYRCALRTPLLNPFVHKTAPVVPKIRR